jgi:hypothetical protein
VLTEGAHPTAVANLAHELVAATEQPVESRCGAKAAIQAQHDLRPPLAAPVPALFYFPQRSFERRQGGRFAPQQGFV